MPTPTLGATPFSISSNGALRASGALTGLPCSLSFVLFWLFLECCRIILYIFIHVFDWFRNFAFPSLGSSSFDFGDFCSWSLHRRGVFCDRFSATIALASWRLGNIGLTGQHEREAYILDLSCSSRESGGLYGKGGFVYLRSAALSH